jgi:ankyrin repeat protein
LYKATQNGHTGVVAALLHHNTASSTRIEDYVFASSLPQPVQRRGVYPSPRALDNLTPLLIAALKSLTEVAVMLLDCGASMSIRPQQAAAGGAAAGAESGGAGCSQTLLHVAASRRNAALCRALLARGAEPRARDQQGRRPADSARLAGDMELGAELDNAAKAAALTAAGTATPAMSPGVLSAAQTIQNEVKDVETGASEDADITATTKRPRAATQSGATQEHPRNT